MIFQRAIILKKSPVILSTLEEASNYVNNSVPNERRSEPRWDKAISDMNAAKVDDGLTEAARRSLYEALRADSLVQED